eukprot:COSAG06_NODE_2644_length_6513_cov_2.398659_6_plen_46_part_01
MLERLLSPRNGRQHNVLVKPLSIHRTINVSVEQTISIVIALQSTIL